LTQVERLASRRSRESPPDCWTTEKKLCRLQGRRTWSAAGEVLSQGADLKKRKCENDLKEKTFLLEGGWRKKTLAQAA